MLKRTIPLLFAVAVVLVAFAPDALANHCARCRFSVDMQWCQFGTAIGSADCYVDEFGVCWESGQCTHFSAAVTPLASEFEVASVERIDEAPVPTEALVAKLDAPKPATEAAR